MSWNGIGRLRFSTFHSLLLLFTIIRDRIDRICDPLKNRYLLQREILGKLFWYILSEDFRHLSIILIYKLLEDIALNLQRVLEDGNWLTGICHKVFNVKFSTRLNWVETCGGNF